MALTKVKASNIVLTTAAASSNDTTPATTQYVTTALANLADSAPSTLNTLNELAAALGDDANFSTTVTNSIAAKLPLAGGTMTGNLTVNAIVDADNYTINGGQGSDGQVLTSTGSGVAWETPSGFNADAAHVFNESGNDVDFRVESNDSANMLVVDGGNNKVLIQANNTASVTNSATALAARTLEVNGNGSEGSDNLSFFSMADGTGNYGMEVSNSAHTAQYDLLINPIMGGSVAIGNNLPGTNHSKANKLVVGSGSACGMAIYNGTNEGWYAFSRDNAANTDAYDGGISYDGSRNLKFHTNAGATRMTINGHGIVGVGTTDFTNMGSSSYKGLKVGGAVIQDSGGGNGSATWIGNNAYVGGSNDFYYDAGGNCSGIQMTSGDINFYTFDGGGGSADAQWSPTSRLHIKENGMIGINTTSPGAYLTIKGGSDNQLQLDSNSTSANTGIFFMENGNNKGELYWRGASDDFRYYNYDRSHEQWVMTAGGKHEFYGKHQGDAVGHFLFTNNGLGDAGSTNCSLVVQNGGTFIQVMGWTTLGARIGTRTGGWDSNSGGDVYFTRQDATSIKLASSGPQLSNGTAISSDRRLKENISDISNGQLAKINALTPRNFTWRDPRKPGWHEGFIAQEVEAVIPEAVYEDNWAPDPDDISRDFDGDIKLIKHEVITARLIKAVQELSAELDAAKARIATLEG